MTYPRSAFVSSTEPGYFHDVARRVRRAFPFGQDAMAGQPYEHRWRWIDNWLYRWSGLRHTLDAAA